MSLIRPSQMEKIVQGIFDLDNTRPNYYKNLIELAIMLFQSTDNEDYINELSWLLRTNIEEKMLNNYNMILMAFDDFRWINKPNAYTIVGDSIDAVEITRHDIFLAFEDIRKWIMGKVVEVSQDIRFTQPLEIVK